MWYKNSPGSQFAASRGFCVNGAEGEIRTLTTVGHYPLKIACLPVPPLRHKFIISVTTGLLEPPLVRLAVQESLQPVRE